MNQESYVKFQEELNDHYQQKRCEYCSGEVEPFVPHPHIILTALLYRYGIHGDTLGALVRVCNGLAGQELFKLTHSGLVIANYCEQQQEYLLQAVAQLSG